MKYSLFSKIDPVGFFSNMLAVILGIVVTFSIQGIIDKHKERENVKSALTLVKDELVSCRADLDSCAAFMDRERAAADYFFAYEGVLASCPADSVNVYGVALISELILTLPDDALELLKTSSLFSSIDDNELSLKIIRAYDQCNALTQVFNRHEQQKSTLINKVYEEKSLSSMIKNDGHFSMTEFLTTESSIHLISQLHNQNGDMLRVSLTDLDAAISAIDEYLAN